MNPFPLIQPTGRTGHSLRSALCLYVIVALFLFARHLPAQSPGSQDTGFNTFTGANGGVKEINVLSNGKIFVSGSFTKFAGTSRNLFALLNPDGSLDPTFNFNPLAFNIAPPADTGSNSLLTVQADGKPIVALYGGYLGYLLVRLNLDGTRDATFSRDISDRAYCAAALSSGQVLVGGAFSSFNGVSPNHLARLNVDGSPDPAFGQAGGGPNGNVNSLVVLANGKIIIAGDFTAYNGVARTRVARLNADGSLDTGYNPVGPNAAVTSVIVQPDGKYILIGNFVTVAGRSHHSIVRLNADGSLDDSYASGFTSYSVVTGGALQADGKLVCTANLTGTPGDGIRLDISGNVDSTFKLSSPNYADPNASPKVYGVKVQADGKILLGGGFWSVNGAARLNVARLNTDLTPDTGFDTGSGIDSDIYAIAAQGDGKVFLAGNFTTVRGGMRNRVARLNADGSADATFDPGTGANAPVSALAVQSNGKLLIGGDFTTVNGVNRTRIARLNADGSLDSTFSVVSGANGAIHTLLVQPDGKVIAGGNFTTYNGVARNQLLRLNSNGTLDTTFDPGAGADGAVQTLTLQSDGKLLVGGYFSSFNGVSHSSIVRLNTNGSVDAAFTGSVSGGQVSACLVQSDGSIVIAGSFNSVNGVSKPGLVRLKANGILDTTFNVQKRYAGSGDGYNALLPQTNGRLLIAGRFDWCNDMSISGLARINADGSTDSSFDAGNLYTGFTVYGLAQQPGNKVLALADYYASSLGLAQCYAGDGPSTAPVATTGAATVAASGNGATLTATINPSNRATSYYFQYGPTISYGGSSEWGNLSVGTSNVAVSASLSNLTPGTTYHYRIFAFSSSGYTYGADSTFALLTAAQNWRQTYFGTTDNSGSAADAADPDGDGISNLLERALGMNPTVAGVSSLPKTTPDSSTGRLILTATRGANTADLNFTAEASADLTNWTTDGVTVVTNTSESFQARDDGPIGPRRFLRLRVTQP